MIRVLVVDDKEQNRYLLRALLQGHGYEVDEARHGAEALVKARQAPPQLIISDLLMPVMDGYTLLRQWKADARLRAIPFVVYTATYTEPKDAQLAQDLGADAFILKPAEPELFITRIREVLATAARGLMTPVRMPEGDEKVLLKEYSEVLVRKLEDKALQLEQTNRALLEDIALREKAEATLRDVSQRLREVEQTERRSINRELHDRIGQNLSALSLILSLIHARLPQDAPDALGARFDDARKLLEDTIAQVRNVMAELHPPALDDFGLLAALRIYAESWSTRNGVPVTVSNGNLDPRLPPAVEMVLFRIAQDAFANVAKHAHATHVEVALAATPQRVTLSIRDDGIGYDTGHADPPSCTGGLPSCASAPSRPARRC